MKNPDSPANKNVIETAHFILDDQLPANANKNIFDQIAEAIAKDQNVLTVPAKTLAAPFYGKLAVLVISAQGQPIGYTRLVELVAAKQHSWYELGTTWVDKAYRNQGIITHAYKRLLASHQDKNILAATSTPAALAVGKKLGFVIVARKDLPPQVWQACCICPIERTQTQDNSLCKRAYLEPQQSGVNCYTRVTQSTAKRLNLKVLTPLF